MFRDSLVKAGGSLTRYSWRADMLALGCSYATSGGLTCSLTHSSGVHEDHRQQSPRPNRTQDVFRR